MNTTFAAWACYPKKKGLYRSLSVIRGVPFDKATVIISGYFAAGRFIARTLGGGKRATMKIIGMRIDKLELGPIAKTRKWME